jgi:hypothetical protein
MTLKRACSGVRKREKRSVPTAIALEKVIAEATVRAIYPIERHGIAAFFEAAMPIPKHRNNTE